VIVIKKEKDKEQTHTTKPNTNATKHRYQITVEAIANRKQS
jgi:hypothetical protein